MAKNERYVVGLDVGTTRISCVVGEIKEQGAVEIVGLGEAPSRGLRKKIVVHLEPTVEAIKTAVEQAVLLAGVGVASASVGFAGALVRSFSSRGVIAVSGKDRTVSRDDVKRVLDAARAVSIPQDQGVLHVLPQEFVLDNQGGVASPIGLNGARLEANVHIVTAPTTSVQNLVTCVNRAGVEVRVPVLEALAASESVLTADEKELGVALIDVGGGTTDLAIFERGSIWHTAVLPVGGSHFTNDLAVGLRTPIPDAERIKIRHGCALASLVETDDAIEVASIGERKPRLLQRQVLAEILEPRAEEIFHLLREEIVRAGFEKMLNTGLVLIGGGSLLPGMTEVAEQVFDLPVRRGQPGGIGGRVEPACGPQYCTAAGLALYGARHRDRGFRERARSPRGLLGNFGGRVRTWFNEMF